MSSKSKKILLYSLAGIGIIFIALILLVLLVPENLLLSFDYHLEIQVFLVSQKNHGVATGFILAAFHDSLS